MYAMLLYGVQQFPAAGCAFGSGVCNAADTSPSCFMCCAWTPFRTMLSLLLSYAVVMPGGLLLQVSHGLLRSGQLPP